MVLIKEWNRGETIRLDIIYVDADDVAFDPTTIEVKIYDPKGSVLKTATYALGEVKKSGNGIYYYDYTIESDAIVGWNITKWTGTGSGFSDVSRGQFKVEDAEEKLYCQYKEVQNRAGISDDVAVKSEIDPFIRDSMAEIDAMYGKSFNYGNEKTQWFDSNRADPKIRVDTVNLLYTPVISITSLKEYDTTGTEIKSYDADEYFVNLNTGRVTLLNTEFVKQVHRIECVYTYGFIQVPSAISSLCAVLSAMRLLTHQIGMQYDDVTSWSAAGLSVGVGEPYTSMARALEFLTKESARMISSIGRMRPSAMIL